MKNWRTSLAGIVTALGLIPTAIEQLHLAEVPNWLVIFGASCSFISFIAQGLLSKDKNVTGVGEFAQTKKEVENDEEIGLPKPKKT